MADRILINADALRSKLKMVASADGLTITHFLGTIGIPHSVFANSRAYYIDFCIEHGLTREELKKVDCSIGLMPENHFNTIIREIGISGRQFLVSEADTLESIEKIKAERQTAIVDNTKSDNANNVAPADYSEIIAKLDEVIMAINKLGNIEMQNMETLNAIRKNWE